MWVDSLVNPKAVSSAFRGGPPPLIDMLLREVRIRPGEHGEQVALLLEWRQLPAGIPDAWRSKGHKAVQLVLSAFATGPTSMQGTFTGSPVTAEITAHDVVVRQPATSATLRVMVTSIDARLHPYSGDWLHEGTRL